MEEKNQIEKESIYPEPPSDTGLFSDVCIWKHADRNYFTFVILSVLFGFFGLDHFYLRSFGTGFAKLFSNITMLGFWYFWDLIQIFTEGCAIKTKGLNSPLDIIRGIGRGTFDFEHSCEFEAKKSFIIFGVLSMFLGMLGLDKFYIGATNQGITKLLCNFIPYFFLFGWLWTAYDSFNFLFRHDSLLKNGLSAPLPFSWLFKETIPVKELFEVRRIEKEVEEEEGEGWFSGIMKLFSIKTLLCIFDIRRLFGLFSISALFSPVIDFVKSYFMYFINIIPFQPLYEALVVPVIRPPVQTAIATGSKAVSIGKAGLDLSMRAVSEAPQALASSVSQITQLTDPSKIQEMVKQKAAASLNPPGMPAVPAVPGLPGAPGAMQVQTGGSNESSINPILAGSLTAILLAGSLKALATYVN